MKRTRELDMQSSDVFWPGVADSLLAALMVVMLLGFGGLVLFRLNPETSELELVRSKRMLEALRLQLASVTAENDRLKAEVKRLQADRPHTEPPIIELTDAQNMNFESGKAQISSEFAHRLQSKEFARLVEIIDEYPVVDTIEIIGHTDDNPIGGARSNLDTSLWLALNGPLAAESLAAGSNADLGLMRAVAVQQQWKRWLVQRSRKLPRDIEVRCYSAANGVLPFSRDELPKQVRDEKARRIEIRFTHLKKGIR